MRPAPMKFFYTYGILGGSLSMCAFSPRSLLHLVNARAVTPDFWTYIAVNMALLSLGLIGIVWGTASLLQVRKQMRAINAR
jgi:hypothetical protein